MNNDNKTLPIWLIRHAITCWWNDAPIKGGALDLDGLTKVLHDVALSAETKRKKKEEEDSRWENHCDHCGKDTMQTHEGCQERDSSMEVVTCTECGWFSIGGDEQQAPTNYE